MLKTEKVTVEGITPLMMNRFPLEPIEAFEKKSPEEQAEYATYRTPDSKLYVPGSNIYRALVAGAVYSKGKRNASLQKPAAACLSVAPEYLVLSNQTYEVDQRPVVVPATKGRIVRSRPRFDSWEVTFELSWNDALLSEKQVRQILDDTGSLVGLLDYRPEKKGPFGRFKVTHFGTGSH